MKSGWEMGYIESSYSGRPARRSKCSIFYSLFYAEKLFHACDEKKSYSSRYFERPGYTLEMFDIPFIFLRRKRAFFMHVLKKNYLLVEQVKIEVINTQLLSDKTNCSHSFRRKIISL